VRRLFPIALILALSLLLVPVANAASSAPARKAAPRVTTKKLLESGPLAPGLKQALQQAPSSRAAGAVPEAAREAATKALRNLHSGSSAASQGLTYVGSYWWDYPWYYDLYWSYDYGGYYLLDVGYCDGVTYCGTVGVVYIYYLLYGWAGPYYY
jgi:hypothetical protein